MCKIHIYLNWFCPRLLLPVNQRLKDVYLFYSRALARYGGLPKLRHLDLSGCLQVTAQGLMELVFVCPNLDHTEFFYCDNIDEGPYPDTASGCQNLQCKNRVCCRSGE